MGKKSTKGKERKEKRREEILRKNESVIAVNKANEVEDPLQALLAFQKFSRNGLDLKLSCKKVADLSTEEIDVLVELVRKNMQDYYERSSWGWKESEKRDEMTEENARFLIAKDEEENVVAMSHFRFDLEDDVEVLYCYEIQLVDGFRGKGLGKFMMQVLELMALKAKMKKVVLTAFKYNLKAVNFFEKMKYTIDENSPHHMDPLHPDEYDYEIYSKVLPVK